MPTIQPAFRNHRIQNLLNNLAAFLFLGIGLMGGAKAWGGSKEYQVFPPKQANLSKAAIPATPVLEGPEFYARVPSSVTLRWKIVPGADLYQVQVATDAAFKFLVEGKANVPAAAIRETSLELTGLESGKSYYWRVAALKSDNDAGYLKGLFSGSMFRVQ